MIIPDKSNVIKTLEVALGVKLLKLSGKKIFYTGKLSGKEDVVICTPESKLYPNGHGWIDLTLIQIEFMQDKAVAIFAFRLEGDKTYYIKFDELRPILTPESMLYNSREGHHWKLHIWPDYIKVIGSEKVLKVVPNRIEYIKRQFVNH